MIPQKIDVEVGLLYKQAVEKFQKAVQAAASGVKIDFDLQSNSLKNIQAEITKFFENPTNGPQLFDAKTPVKRKDLLDYLKKFNKDLSKLIATNPQLAVYGF